MPAASKLAGMKTEHPLHTHHHLQAGARWLGHLLLALMLLLPLAATSLPDALGADAPAAAKADTGKKDAKAAPAPAPTGTPPAPADIQTAAIPAANVVARAESDTNTLNIIRNRMQGAIQYTSIRQQLLRLGQDATDTRALSHLAMDSDSQRRMRDIEPTWGKLQSDVTAIDRQLTQGAESLQEDFARLGRMEKTWTATQDADEISSAPQVIRTRIQEVLNLIQDTRRSANKVRSGIFDLQAQSSKLQATIASEQTLLKNTLTNSIDSLFKPDSPSVYGAANLDNGRDITTLTGVARLRADGRSIADYLRSHRTRTACLLICLIVCYATLYYLRPKVAAKSSEQPVLRSVRWLLADPLSVSVLMTVGLAAVLLPYPPGALNLVLGLVALLPTVLLLRKVVEKSLATYLYWLLAMYAFNQAPEILRFDAAWERLFFQSQMFVTVALLVHLQRRRRRAFLQARAEAAAENETVSSEALPPEDDNASASSGSSTEETRQLRLTGYVINTVLAGCATALGSDLLGFTRLARFVSQATLNSLFAGVILLAGVLVLLSLLRLAGNLRPLNRLKMLNDDGALIEARLRRIIHWVAALMWAAFTLEQMMLLSPFTDWVAATLSTPVHIGQVSVSLADILRFGVVLWLTMKLSQLMRYILDREVFTRVMLPPGIPYALNSVLNYAIWIGGLLLAIASTGISLDRFTIFASAVGVGVGFGLQSIVNNFVSGLIVLFERPIRVGDSVDMAGQSGKVKRIGIRASILRTGAGADVIVPNSQLIANQVVNWTLSDNQRRIEIALGVDYESDPAAVIKLLTEVARGHDDILATPVPNAQFIDFGSSALQFKLFAWTARADRIGAIRSELCVAIHEALKENGVKLASS
ncbi:hypothetical protein EHV23_09280 [Lautropia dentalis]|uniref:Mechanosensitive ion channel protein MscS n=1 Tax=Lautropia dentalis TaxID=2490857 RepID=A0A3R8T0H3_9BURK|nr:mechanosensitive ion channel domain-containing protein [Lautropia dentalis]RRN43619.1 hypothetical protein EHV23_09280 [Lautropia dentalis]